MQWQGQGIILSTKRHGEHGLIINALTAEQGRMLGFARSSKAQAALWQPGNIVQLRWRARLAEQLGTWQGELVSSPLALFLDEALPLASLRSALAMTDLMLPERLPVAQVHAALLALLNIMEGDILPVAYARYELGLLQALGYGVDLSACCLTGTTDDLAFVSPRSGRAVARVAAAEWQDKLLPLPPFLLGSAVASSQEVLAALRLTGHFWPRETAHDLPPARRQLLDLISKAANLAA